MRIVVVGPRDEDRDALVKALREAGFDVPGAVSAPASVRRVVGSVQPDAVVVCPSAREAGLPDRIDGVPVVRPRAPLDGASIDRRLRRALHQLASPGRDPEATRGEAEARPVGAPRQVAVPHPLVLIGASTGGPQVLEAIVRGLPASVPPLLVAQHMPAYQTSRLAARLDGLCALSVREAVDGAVVSPGEVWIAPGGMHLEVARRGGAIALRTSDEPLVNGHRPSVDVLFHSLARIGAKGALAMVLTGMGSDGADGLLALRQAGALTLVQDQATSTVYGMPRVAWERGGAVRQQSVRGLIESVLKYSCR